MVQEAAAVRDQPYYLTVRAGDADPIQAGERLSADQLEDLRRAGWDVTGDTAKNPETGTKVTVGVPVTSGEAEEINDAIDAGTPAAGGAPAAGGGGGAAPPPPASGAAPPGPAADGPPPSAGEKHSKGDKIDAVLMQQLEAAGWKIEGNIATSPSGTKFMLGEALSYEQAAQLNDAGIPKKT